jgi:epoxide hydrolase 4
MSEIQHSFVRANGIRFHVAQVENDAPLVLFLHGFPECWYSWKHQLSAVAKAGFRAWAPDMRGFNTSDKPRGVDAYHLDVLALDVEELLNVAGVEKAIIVGHDWGALVAWRFAMNYPERVEKLVILNVPHPARQYTGFFMPSQWLKSWYILAFQLPYLPEMILTRNPRQIAEGLRLSAVRKEAFKDADLDVYAKAIAQPNAMHSALNYYRAWVRWGFGLPVKPIDAPTMMIWGEQDIALNKELSYGTEKWVRDFRIHYIPDSGHWVQVEAAQEVNRLLLEFIGDEQRC